MSCPYCGNDKNNVYDWSQCGQFLIKCGKCTAVFRPSKAKYDDFKEARKKG